MSNYYESDDLKKFGDIGKHGKEHADLFFKYYAAVTGSDGALTKREKSLIALAVAHSEKCPYCIDAYTTACLEAGANPAANDRSRSRGGRHEGGHHPGPFGADAEPPRQAGFVAVNARA